MERHEYTVVVYEKTPRKVPGYLEDYTELDTDSGLSYEQALEFLKDYGLVATKRFGSVIVSDDFLGWIFITGSRFDDSEDDENDESAYIDEHYISDISGEIRSLYW